MSQRQRHDDSILSAFLDHQLDPEQSRAVESAVSADPRLKAKLEALRKVRDLIASLSRPAGVDVATAVASEVRAHQVARRPRLRPRRSVAWATASVLATATAASLLILVLIESRGARKRTIPEPQRSASVLHTTSILHSTPENPARPTHPSSPGSAGETRIADREPGATQAGSLPPPEVAPTPSAIRQVPDESAMLARHSLEDPSLRLVIRVGGDATPKQVAAIVEQSTHRPFFQITVPPGLVLDPNNPEPATVFVLTINESQLAAFRDRLASQFVGKCFTEPVDPSLVTQLTEMSQVIAFSPSPAADVVIPPSKLAFRTRDGTAGDRAGAPPGIEASTELGNAHDSSAGKTAEVGPAPLGCGSQSSAREENLPLVAEDANPAHAAGEGRGSAPAAAGGPAVDLTAENREDRPVVVLIWLKASPRD